MSPEFFVDRSLGRIKVPTLLRRSGWSLRTLAEVYGVPHDEEVRDTEWLRLAGQREWPVLMKDDRIRYRAAERDALLSNGVIAFCLTGGNLRADEMAGYFLTHKAAVWRACAEGGPALYTVSRRSLRRLEL